MRAEGNWLLEIGFERIEPPATHKGCSSVYVLKLPRDRCVVLRGFGVFFGDVERGGVFVRRYEFRPRYTTDATLECPPWSDADLPKLRPPSRSQRSRCGSLTADLVEWIGGYEAEVIDRLGIEYRRATRDKWDNGMRSVVPAEDMVPAWGALGQEISDGLGRGLG